MKRYEFKDSRPIFKWMYIAMAINILNSVLFIFTFQSTDVVYSPVPFSVMSSIVPIIALIVIRSNTYKNVYAYESKISCGKTIYYMMITEIVIDKEIIIKAESDWMTIKLIDLENNYDKYEELIAYILERVDEKTAVKYGNAKNILQPALDELKTRFASKKLTNGKVELGGWLTWFNISAYFGCIAGGFMILGLLFALEMGESMTYMVLMQRLPIGVISIFTIIALYKRKSNVKYWLAALPLVTLAYSILSGIQGIAGYGDITLIILEVVRIILSVVYAILIAKVYIGYIDDFARPKQTLIN